MVWRIARPVAVGAAASMLLAGLAAPAAGKTEPARTGPGFERHHGANGEADVNVCSTEVPPGFAQCHARERLVPGVVAPADVIGNNGAYDPAYLQSAYNTESATRGTGQTVAVVDAYDAPNAE